MTAFVLVPSWLPVPVPNFQSAGGVGVGASTSQPTILSGAEAGHQGGER